MQMTTQQIDEEISAWLRRSRLRRTDVRVNVMSALLRLDAPAYAEQLFQRIQADRRECSRDSVYRVLRELESCGFAQREWRNGQHGVDGAGSARALFSARGRPSADGCMIECPGCGRRHGVHEAGVAARLADVLRLHGFRTSGQLAVPALCLPCAAVPA